MARLKQQVNVDKKKVAECSNPFTGGPAFTSPRERNEEVPEISRGAFAHNSRHTTAPSNSKHQVPEIEARYDRDCIPFSLEREFMEESSRGFRFSGNDISEYPAYRHRFHLLYCQLRSARPDLLLRWIEATMIGQARRYIRSAFSIFDRGRACDVVWEQGPILRGGQKNMSPQYLDKEGQNTFCPSKFMINSRTLSLSLCKMNIYFMSICVCFS